MERSRGGGIRGGHIKELTGRVIWGVGEEVGEGITEGSQEGHWNFK
jgi:hypothetical protein